METILNTALIRQRRLELSISKRELARRINVTAPAVIALERGTNHHALKLREVNDLARALSLPITSLIAESAAAPPPAPDDVALEAALLSIRGRRRMIHIARVLGWPRQRVEAAAEALTARLIHTGAVLENTDLGIQIRPRPGALDVELPTTDRVRDAKHARPLSTLEAAILLDAVQTGHISNRHIVANATRVAAGSLLKRGYLQPDDTGLHPSHDVSSTLTPTPSRRPRERKGKRP
jgi:transcriptional regulator with XRE-family HTH domain